MYRPDIVQDNVRRTSMNLVLRREFVKIERFLAILLNIIRWCHGVVSTRRKSQWPIGWWWRTYSLVGYGLWTSLFCFPHKKFMWTLYQSLVISLPLCIHYWSVPRYLLLVFPVNLFSRYRWVCSRAPNISKRDNRKLWRTWNTDDLTTMFVILKADSCSNGQEIVSFMWQ